MMIGANFPDIDILSAPFGRAVEFRRGWTHGVLALVVLPFVLTGLMLLYDRYRRRGRDPAVPAQILLLSAISIATHPTLDWMNSYGLRWLMPFDGTWFYGDSLFIIDPWLLIVLGAGVWFSRQRERSGSPRPWQPARVATAVAAAYMVGMFGLQNFAEKAALEAITPTGRASQKLVVTAFPANPLRWRVHADDGARYSNGSVSVPSGRLALDSQTLDKGADDTVVAMALQSPEARPFLDWARLPFYRVSRTAEGTFVRVTDARYGASLDIPVPSSE
jgi:inner membrane protein